MLNTILFDLDGTLLPMDLKEFEHDYFKRLCVAFSEVKPEELINAIWTGVKAIVKNDGSDTNRVAFAKAFSECNVMDFYENEERFSEFYKTEFQKCINICRITDTSKKLVKILKDKGYGLVIATNPLFPQVATYSRLNWLNLNPDDFLLVTTYENTCHAKPNSEYYVEICDKLNINPADCVMIGNDAVEDGSATAAGIDFILVSDCQVNAPAAPTGDYRTYTLNGLLEWANELPELSGNASISVSI